MKNIVIRVISGILLLATFSVIFYFSSQNADKSGGVSTGLVSDVIRILPGSQDLSEHELNSKIAFFDPIIRKIAHFSLYFLVGFFSMCFINTYNLKLKHKFIISIFIGFLYACSDEIHQSFVPGRGPMATDVGIDTVRNCFWKYNCDFFYKFIKKIYTKLLQKK